VEAWRLVTFVQDHDQIGNRAAGDRISASLSPRRLAIAAVLAVLTPSTPMLFMGEEWGASTPWQFFTAHPEPELGRVVAEGRVSEFARMGWDPDAVPDPQDEATFARSKLDWSELDVPPHAELLAQYRALIALRAAEPDLHSPRFGDLSATVEEDARRVTFVRGGIRIRLNLGGTTWTVGGAEQALFRTSDDVGDDPVTLPADSALVSRVAE
jgi:maltooligosyltrehalose trehalohydrolase